MVTGSGTAGAIADRLTAAGWRVHTRAEDAAEAADLRLVLVELGGGPATTVLAETLATAGRFQTSLQKATGRTAFVTLTRLDGAFGLEAGQGDDAVLGSVTGLVKTLGIEAPELFCRALDVHVAVDAGTAADLVLTELDDPRHELRQVAYTAGLRRRTLTSVPWAPTDEQRPPGSDDLIVVTGGARGITAQCAVALAERHHCGLLLVGRSPLLEEPEWARDVPDSRLRAEIVAQKRDAGEQPKPRDVEAEFRRLAAGREIRATLDAVRQCGATVEYLAADVADAVALGKVLAPYREKISGLVHGAGILADQRIVDKSAADAERVLAPKVHGWSALLAAVDPGRLRHVAAFSSAAGWHGNTGQADYAMANEALNRLVRALRRAVPEANVTALNWGAWAGGMVSPELARMFAERGVPLIEVTDGVRIFTDRMTTVTAPGDEIVVIGPDMPLSAVAEVPAWTGPVRRELSPLATDPAVEAHAIGGRPVLPMTGALGAILNVAGRARAARDIVVFSGVVLGDDAPEELHFARNDNRITVLDERARPRYRADLIPGTPAPAPRLAGLPPLSGGTPIDVYGDGTLFHGPALQGIRRLLAEDGTGLVFACRLRDPGLAGGAYGTDDYHPALMDLLLQALSVWVRRRHGASSLPSRAAGFRLYKRIPDDTDFYAVVRDVVTEHSVHRADLLAVAADGTVLAVFDGLEAVSAEALNDKFREGVR